MEEAASDKRGSERKIELGKLVGASGDLYAVFQRSESGHSAKFKLMFDNQEDAEERAQQYASNEVSKGKTDFTFYVVKLVSRYGIENGRMVAVKQPAVNISLEGSNTS